MNFWYPFKNNQFNNVNTRWESEDYDNHDS